MMAQTYPYIIYGVVTLNGTPQASVTVSIKNNTKNQTGTTVTNASGEYAISLSDPTQFSSGYDVGDTVTISWSLYSKTITLPAGAGTTVGGETVNIELVSGVLAQVM